MSSHQKPADEEDSLAKQLAELRAHTAAQEAENQKRCELLQKQLEFSSQFNELKSEISYFKWIAAAAALALTVSGTVVGYLGYRSVNDYIRAIKQETNDRLNHISSYYYDFARADALMNAGDTREALPILIRCFNQDPYDEAVLRRLLTGINDQADWELAKKTIANLKKDEAKYNQLKDPLTYNDLAAVEIQMGLEFPEWLEEGHSLLTKSHLLAEPGDLTIQKYYYYNEWLYALAKKDFPHAHHYVGLYQTLPNRPQLSWDVAKSRRFFKTYLSQNPTLESQVGEMWNELHAISK